MTTKVKTQKSMKRILKVRVKRMFDDDPDTSWMGEYSNKRTSEFSIDREHSLDCAINNYDARIVVPLLLGHAIEYLCKQVDERYADGIDDAPCQQEAIALLEDAESDVQACDCDGGDMGRNEYQYFNPSFNYVDKLGYAKDLTPEDVQKYVREDYKRMEELNFGYWSFVGLRAETEVQVEQHGPIQTITSGGLWGIESDAGKEYFAEVREEELSQLKDQLRAMGFSKRAISAAFRDVEQEEE
jgi:hypothetical protein